MCDVAIFNREIYAGLSQRYRSDELHRLDVLELVGRGRKFHFLTVICKELSIWEDEERILRLDKVNLDKLIRENLVSAELGVSLMNDSVITRRLVKIMLRAAKQIFGGGLALEQELDFLEPDLEEDDLSEQTNTQIELDIHSLDELK